MANFIYVKAAERMLAAALAGTLPAAGTLKAALVKNTYLQSQSADEFYSDISAYVVGTPQEVENLSFTGGKLDGDDVSVPDAAAAETIEAVVLYVDTGNPATSWLLAFIDQAGGLPHTTDGGPVEPTWDNGTYRILSLV